LLALAVLGVAAPVRAQTFKVGSFTKTAGTAVAVQNQASASTNSAATLSIAAFNPGALSNRLLVVGLSSSATLPSLTVTYGGVGLTLVPGSSGTNGATHTEMWYLVNPSSTASNIQANWTGNYAVVMGAVAFNNVDQTVPVQSGTFAIGTSTTPSVTITSGVGDMTMAIAAKITNLGAPTQAQRWLDTSQASIKGFGGTAVGAATVTHSAAAAGTSTVWVSSGVSVKQVGGQTQAVPHLLGQVPSALILWTSGSATGTGFGTSDWSSFGMSDGTTSYSTSRSSLTNVTTPSASRRAAQKALTIVQYGQLLEAEATLTSWDATNINFTWSSNNGAGYVIHFLAIGGVSAKVLTWTPTVGTGSKSITGVGFQPNVVFHLQDFDSAALPSSVAGAAFMLGVMDSDGKQWATAVNSTSGTAPSDTARAQRTDACIEEITGAGTEVTRANWVSMNADGFTVNYSVNGAQNNVYSLALAGLNLQAGTFSKMTAGGTPAFVQQAAKDGGPVASTTQTFPAPSTTGNLIVVSVGYDSPAATISSVTDSKGNTYNLAVGPTNWATGGVVHTSTYYARNITGGGAAITITVTLSGASTSVLQVYQFEYSGVATVSPVDKTSSNFGTGLSPVNSGSQTTTQVNELIYGLVATTVGGVTGGASYTTRSAFNTQFIGDKNAPSTGSYNVDATFTGAQDWVSHMVTFKGNLQSWTGLGFLPSAVFLASFQDITRATPVVHARLGMGASDGTREGTTAIQDADALSTTSVQNFDKTTKVFAKVDNTTSTIDAEADLASLDADGFTLNWTTNDAVATEMLYVAFAPMWATEVRLISFTGAKYPRGALLQWKTGYEIDNLGFNLYREIGGVRTKVNATLIAGSGLQAGRGGVVTAEQTYARWDLAAAASDPRATYWLEDVEFNGRSRYHGPLSVEVSSLTEPTTIDSSELGAIGNATNSRRIFFNYNEDPVHPGPRAVPAPVEPEVTRQWALAAATTVKMGIQKPGWYRVTQPELVAAGLNPGIDPGTLQLFVDGTEQAIRVTGASGGAFAPGAAIDFYASGIETPYTDTRIYWLQAGVQNGRRIAVDASGPFAPSTSTRFSSTLRRKDRSVYFAALRNGDAENWFGPMVSPEPAVPDPDNPASPTLTLTSHNVDRSVDSPAQLMVTLQGVTTMADASTGHRVGVLVNGTDVGEMTFAGQTDAEQTFSVDLALLAEGANTVTLIARGGDADSSLVDVIRLDYPHAYQADADRLRLTVDAPGSIAIGGFASASIRVFDITDRTTPVELAGTVATAAGLWSVTVQVPGSGPRTLMAFSDETVASPAFVRANHPSSWHTSSNAYDYVLISHADFLTQVAPLAALRQGQGHHAVVVDVEDVYDEFSFGEKTPQAIRDFLQWARTNWATAPKFVVLAGDATIDPRDYEGLGNADYVPTKQVPMSNVVLETASDDWFVDFGDNGLPDVAIGRLSVRTAAQAEAVVTKIVGYDRTGPQPWQKDVLLVADQNDDHSNFERFSDNLSTLLPRGYTAHRISRGALGGTAAHQALVDRVNEGHLIVNYTGHGSTGIWGSDGGLLTRPDVTGSWTNAAKLPFVVAMNCLNGLFNAIYGEADDENSLAETLQRAPNGGAVAVWASSSVTPAATQALVNQELFRLTFGGTYATLGEAVVAAKRVVSSPDLRRSWIFFGDPAMHLSGTPLPAVTPPVPVPIPPPVPVPPAPPVPAPAEPAPAPPVPGVGPGPSLLPGAPSGLTSSVFGSTLILSWAAPAAGAAPGWYVIEAGTFSGARDFVYATGTLATSFTADNVSAGTYFVHVRAENGAGMGASSNEVIVSVGSGSGSSPRDAAPGPPGGLSVAVSGSSLTFVWNASTVGGAPGAYWIEAGSSVGLSDLASFSTGSTARSFFVSRIPAGAYHVRVRAVNEAGVSASSNEVLAVVAGSAVCSAPPAAPSGLRFAIRGSTVTVAWNAAAGSPTAYILEAGSFPAETNLLVSDTGTIATTLVATGVGSATYFVRVRARNSCGTSSSSNEVAIVVP
jgi:hypothetical protein